jgi:hypothetical protein
MSSYIPELHYYALSLALPRDGDASWNVYTHWVGWADDNRCHEIRAASRVRPERMAAIWENSGEDFVVVNDLKQLFIFLHLGGNALVEHATADRHLHDIVKPESSVRSGNSGFRAVADIPESEFARAPTPKQRMRILKRDSYRCRICGRRSSDHVDVELHVHHIRPWARGGLTEDENLITLCHTCHRGLEPHDDPVLFELLPSRRQGRSVGAVHLVANTVSRCEIVGQQRTGNDAPKSS